MIKTVAVMNGLSEVADALRREGIKVVDVADIGATISAIVYSAKVSSSAAGEKQRAEANEPSSGGGTDDMVLMLNADEMTIAEIIARIKSGW